MIFFSKRKPEMLLTSSLYNENSFYKAFLKDLTSCRKEIIIESPFITSSRITMFVPMFKNLLAKGINMDIITRYRRFKTPAQ